MQLGVAYALLLAVDEPLADMVRLHSVVVDETAPVRERIRCAEMLLTMAGYFDAK